MSKEELDVWYNTEIAELDADLAAGRITKHQYQIYLDTTKRLYYEELEYLDCPGGVI